MYKLINATGHEVPSLVPGELGGYRPKKIYGRLDCWAAIAQLPNYAKSRVFFFDEHNAIAAGYRPCAKCMPERYAKWKKGGIPGTPEYPWLVVPRTS
jgi:hypothetical protein